MAKAAPQPRKGEPQVDASMNVKLNPVQLPDGTIVPWAVAFPNVGRHL